MNLYSSAFVSFSKMLQWVSVCRYHLFMFDPSHAVKSFWKYIRELKTVFKGHGSVDDLTKELDNILEVTEFLQTLHRDNPFISRCLARSCASFRRVLASLESGQDCFLDEEYGPFNRYNRAEMMMPMAHKLSSKDYSVLCRMEEMMSRFLEKWEDHASAHFLPLKGCGDLLWPVVCECNNMLPHLKGLLI